MSKILYQITGIIDYPNLVARRANGTEQWELARVAIVVEAEAADPAAAVAEALDMAREVYGEADWWDRPTAVEVGRGEGQMKLPIAEAAQTMMEER
ncbi:MAG: hypothetical protein ACYTEQ_09530 [Planctomycetota bacterium]